MRYYLRRHALNPQVMVEIDQARYEYLAKARKTLVDAGSFEQRYEQLLGNFVAFELFCTRVSVRGAFEFEHRYDAWAETISEANRHAINLLTTARLYADHVVRDFKHVLLDEPFAEVARRLLREAHTNNLSYRLVWELRNHVQHRAIAVHGIKGRGKEAPLTEASLVYCLRKNIKADQGRFKQSVLEEMSETTDLLYTFREYVAAISNVQCDLRKIVDAACKAAREATQRAMDEFSEAQCLEERNGNAAVGLAAVIEDNGKFDKEVPLLLSWDDVRVALGLKNSRKMKFDPTTVRGRA